MSIEKNLKDIEKTFDVIISKIKDAKSLDIETISSGSYSVDDAIGVGGLPRGRIIEMYGQPSGGKTTLALLAIAEAQKAGGTAAFIDAEHAFSPKWAQKLGVDVDNLIFTQPDEGEKALELVIALAKTNEVDIIVVDSTAALVPRAMFEKDIADHSIALQARMLSKALPQMLSIVGKSKAVVIFINQTRTNPVMMFGNPETTPGGAALKFYSSVRISVNKKGGTDIKEGGVVVGHNVRIKITKNKVAPPFKEAEITLRFDSGVDHIGEIINLAKEKDIINMRGAIYEYGGQSWKGITAITEALNADEALRTSILNEIKSGVKKDKGLPKVTEITEDEATHALRNNPFRKSKKEDKKNEESK